MLGGKPIHLHKGHLDRQKAATSAFKERHARAAFSSIRKRWSRTHLFRRRRIRRAMHLKPAGHSINHAMAAARLQYKPQGIAKPHDQRRNKGYDPLRPAPALTSLPAAITPALVSTEFHRQSTMKSACTSSASEVIVTVFPPPLPYRHHSPAKNANHSLPNNKAPLSRRTAASP